MLWRFLSDWSEDSSASHPASCHCKILLNHYHCAPADGYSQPIHLSNDKWLRVSVREGIFQIKNLQVLNFNLHFEPSIKFSRRCDRWRLFVLILSWTSVATEIPPIFSSIRRVFFFLFLLLRGRGRKGRVLISSSNPSPRRQRLRRLARQTPSTFASSFNIASVSEQSWGVNVLVVHRQTTPRRLFVFLHSSFLTFSVLCIKFVSKSCFHRNQIRVRVLFVRHSPCFSSDSTYNRNLRRLDLPPPSSLTHTQKNQGSSFSQLFRVNHSSCGSRHLFLQSQGKN